MESQRFGAIRGDQVKQRFRGWQTVSQKLYQYADENSGWFNEGQRASLRVIADRIPENGLILADEVGMGKTRIAVALARSVIESGGRTAILVPPGLGFQWMDELRHGGIKNTPQLLRSMWGYLAAWDPDRESELEPWFNDEIVLISHAFANWHLGASTHPRHAWRWALLPALYAEWRKRITGRYPRGYYFNKFLADEWVSNAAKSICKNIPRNKSNSAYRRAHELSEHTPWPGALDAAEYKRNEHLRPWFEGAVGLGLGAFDLIIIDEAHKSRGTESGLSRLLEFMVLQSDNARRLGMTATPVELHVAQWQQTLSRVSVGENSLADVSSRIEKFADAVQRVRESWRSSLEAREEYGRAAQGFQRALSPYLLRRDKREDDAVKNFEAHTDEGIDSYRLEREISVRIENLSPAWRRAVCAAESLSLVTRQAEDPVAKRLRLTMGSGHAVATLIDQIQRDEQDDRKQEEYEEEQCNGPLQNDEPREADKANGENKRLARGQWWRSLMEQVFIGENDGLFGHPAILAAVEAIEEYTRKQEKVLVFGRFTRPLRALTDLLNAREMLRCLQENRTWPQSKVHSSAEDSEWPAVKAAHRQLKCTSDLDEIDRTLDRQYTALEKRRERLRDHLFDWIGEGLGDRDHDARALLKSATISARSDEMRALLARALGELLESEDELNPAQCAQAFVDLITALRDRDEADPTSDHDLDETQANELWIELENRLLEEYGSQRGTFARLMYGETKLPTRRALQLAFNRAKSFPRILVAQSLVGREGLNLHQACRVVVLLHPEWNPGVVEQQIGRVDRVGSHWSKELDRAINSGLTDGALPRIEICPVIFQGTYDEYNWKVLNQRWDDLRAQLHGMVVPQRFRSHATTVERELIRELDEMGPDFSPLRQGLSTRAKSGGASSIAPQNSN
jgi:superfamily II DNA or RNA helicase